MQHTQRRRVRKNDFVAVALTSQTTFTFTMRTMHIKGAIDVDTANAYYTEMYNNLPWDHSIKNTRKGTSLDLKQFPEIEHLVLSLMKKYTPAESQNLMVLGLYANLYRDGNDYAPSHRHVGQVQYIISLGETRALKVGSKTYALENGDLCIFGSASHSVLKDPSITKPRISIAVFAVPMDGIAAQYKTADSGLTLMELLTTVMHNLDK